jgi:PAS domain S-box-containing protein
MSLIFKRPGNQIDLDWLKHFLLILLSFASALALGVSLHYYTISQTQQVMQQSSELLNVGLARSELNRDLAGVVSDLVFLSSYLERQGFQDDGELDLEAVSQLFYTFTKEKRLYDQIRFLDLSGLEKVRVNFRDGATEIVAQEKLQDKSKRYYVVETRSLSPGEIYISPLDLNVEEGGIELPHKPMMRFAVPVFAGVDEKRGILVLNYLGGRLLSRFQRAAANIAGHIHLINARGYWLSGPNRADSWGFMLSHGKRFADAHPAAWDIVSTSASGQITTDDGLLTYDTVTPWVVASQTMHGVQWHAESTPADAQHWKVVSQLPQALFKPSLMAFARQQFPLYVTILTILLLGSWLIASANLRHRNAKRQNEYERRFRQTLEDMQLAAVSLDRDFRLVFCNDYFLRLTGWELKELMNSNWIERFIPPQERRSLIEAFQGLINAKGVSRDVEVDLIARAGKRLRFAWHNTLSTDSQGNIIGITAIGEDVSQRRKAEEKVRKLSRAVEQSPSIVMLTDCEGNIEYVNPKFSEVTGFDALEVVGQKSNLLKSGEMTAGDYKTLWETLKQGGEWRGEFHNRRKNGELYWESASISALKNDADEITHFVAVKEDITQRKRLEQEVELRNQELARTQALTTMGRMASMIAHDLRNPLSSVKMCMQMLGKQANEELGELSDIALDQIRYMENILTDMLSYAKPEAAKIEWINIDKLLDTTLLSLQKRIVEAHVTTEVQHGSGLPALPGDANKLRQLFSNLIVNAIQATKPQTEREGVIEIRSYPVTGELGNAVEVEVCDNGEGLTEEVEKLFEPFFTTRTKGTGLGLAIVRQIAEQHHGKVSLESRQQGGVCARVCLPTTPIGSDDSARP